jgi:tetratricopeptide (TPR) repeat protein
VGVTPKRFLLVPAAAAVVVAVVLTVRWGSRSVATVRTPAASQSAPNAASADYVDSTVCSSCHADIARTYKLTGMGRSFSAVLPGTVPDLTSLYHKASDRYYEIVRRDGRTFQRRHERDKDGQNTSVVELSADYVIGSGNHARSYLHRTDDGTLVELPISWYAERGGYWAMSPGYDRPAHLDFRRVVTEDCLSCHNAYPRTDAAIPEGIDCQRCHGPGRAHVEAIAARNLELARRAIVNPGKLDRDRQLETCMQCHLEPTSSPLPFQVRRYDRQPLSYIPGKPLGDYFIYFDHAKGAGPDDKFEIAGAAYRLRQSACFQRSQMTCLTCHDPHDIPRGQRAVDHYVAVCSQCHQHAHATETPRLDGSRARATCLDCHMPKRRTQDAVHVAITDHFIQRRRSGGDLLAPLTEDEGRRTGDYRGEVDLYYPPSLPSTPDNDLYLALAQVQQASNLAGGIPRLQRAIEEHHPTNPEFYYELARAYAKAGDDARCVRWCNEALRRSAGFVPALKERAAAELRAGRSQPAAEALEQAAALHPRDAYVFADLGNAYLQQGRLADAQRALTTALALDATMPLANNTRGLVALKQRDSATAEIDFREAIRHQPDLAEARNNLGNLLAGRGSYAEAAHQFEKALVSRPDFAEARHSHAMVLALVGDESGALREYELALQANPSDFSAHLELGEMLARRGRSDEAGRHFASAGGSPDPEVRQSAIAGLAALSRSRAVPPRETR